MAVDNIDLSGEIKAWKDAAYGKDVRAANVAAFEKIQGTVNNTVQNVNQASEDASSASQNAQKAVDDIQSAIETATSKASEAAGSATAADTSKKAAASSAAAADNSKTQAAASAAEAKKIAQGLGDFDGTAAKVKTTDTYGLVVSALGESTAQALIDAIANKVVNELINKNKIVNNLLATDASTVLAGTQGAALDKRLVAAEKAVTQLNSDFRLSRSECSKNTESNVEMEICQYRATKDIIVSLAGWYTTPGNSTGVRRVNIYAYNMSCFLSGTPAGQNLVGFSGVFFLKSGETIGIRVNQTSGSTLSSKIFIHSNVAFS